MISLQCCSRRIKCSIEFIHEEDEEYDVVETNSEEDQEDQEEQDQEEEDQEEEDQEEEDQEEEDQGEEDQEEEDQEEEKESEYEKIPEQIPEKIPEQIPEPPKPVHKKPNYNHRYWPSPRAVLFAKYLYVYQLQKPSPPRLTHIVALELLARHVKCSVEDFLKINPLTFIEKYLGNTNYLYKKSIIDSREYSNLHWQLIYEAGLAAEKKHKAETQAPIE